MHKHANMADGYPDHDSAFGDDDIFWNTNLMFPTNTVAGTKRDAESLTQPIGSASTDHREPQADRVPQCCAHCPDPCPDNCNGPPLKRRASAQKVSAYHSLAAEPPSTVEADCRFPDDCFEKFCQECSLDTSCPPDCPVPVSCPADATCTTPEPCWDPHCDQKEAECADGCVDPDCTKSACPEKPCFCQKCDARPCPLGDPDNDCHFAHSAPTTGGTIYCYDHAPCHFQEGHHTHNDSLASYETYPCFSQAHGYLQGDGVTAQGSSAPTPALSHSNFTSLESAFTSEASPSNLSNCFLGVSGEHCHIDNSCCHGPKRACGDDPTASPHQLDIWNTSTAQGNGLANTMMNFGFNSSHPTSPVSATPSSFNNTIDNSMLGFTDNSWMLVDPALSPEFNPDILGLNKLDFLASAVQQDLLKPTQTLHNGALQGMGNSSASGTEAQCVCKWCVILET